MSILNPLDFRKKNHDPKQNLMGWKQNLKRFSFEFDTLVFVKHFLLRYRHIWINSLPEPLILHLFWSIWTILNPLFDVNFSIHAFWRQSNLVQYYIQIQSICVGYKEEYKRCQIQWSLLGLKLVLFVKHFVLRARHALNK